MKKFIYLITLCILSFTTVFPQWNASISIVPYPSPYISDWENHPGQVGQIIISNNSGSPETVQILSTATRNGSEIFNGTSDQFTVQPGVPATIDNTRLLRFAEANFPNSSLKAQVVRTGRLPEGHYELCITIQNSANPSALPLVRNVCASFDITYPDPPNLISPVNEQNVTDTYPVFTWTPVLNIPADYTVTYSLKVVEILDGQNPQTALDANIPQLEQDNLTTTTLVYPIDGLPLDTGKTYAWQITALDQYGLPPTNNRGKSEIFTFTYSGTNTSDTTGSGSALASTGSGCLSDISSSIDHTDINSSGLSSLDHLTIGGFNLHLDRIQQNSSGNTYQGNGYITWSPFGSPIKLAVTFNNIKINTSGAVYQGIVTTNASTNSDISTWTSLASASDPISALRGPHTNGQYNSLNEYISSHLINTLGGNGTPAVFPLGFRNDGLSNEPVLALMGITFTPNGADMNVLYNLNITEADKWISFFNTCFRITANGIGTGGVLYLPWDEPMTLSDGKSFRFNGCPHNTDGTNIDTANSTYVEWNGNGLETIVASAKLALSQSDIVPVNEATDTRMSRADTLQLKFNFADWNDWIAGATPGSENNKFEVAGLPGFTISVSGNGYYDHSASRDPAGISFPDNYTAPIGNTFQGLYFQNLTMSLPEGFRTFGSEDRINFPFHNFVLDDNGVTTHINGNNILPFSSGDDEGDLGGWPFSVDHIDINIINGNPQSDMSMTGQLKLPLSNSSAIDYTCNMNTSSDDSLIYHFLVSDLQGEYDLDVWPATLNLDDNSIINITHDEEGIAVTATLEGTMSINISAGSGSGSHTSPTNVLLPGLPFQDVTISNREEGGEEGIGFSAEAWGAEDGEEHHGGESTSGSGESSSSSGETTTGEGGGSESHSGGEGEQGEVAGIKVNLGRLDFTGPNLTPVESEPHTYKLSLGMNIELNLGFGGESEIGIGGGTGLTFEGDIHVPGTAPPTIDNIGVDVDEVSVDGDFGPLKVQGSLGFLNHNRVYGTGVDGRLKVQISEIEVNFMTRFGTTNDGVDYWGLGGSLYMENGIQVGPVGINGFGGGFAYNMVIPSVGNSAIDGSSSLTTSTSEEAQDINLRPVSAADVAENPMVFQLKIFLSLIRPKLVNGCVTVAAQISHSGFDDLTINGYVALLSLDPPENTHPVGSADLHLDFDFADQIFSGQFNGNVQLGVASAHVPVWMYADPSNYYFWVGKPATADRVRFVLLQIPPEGTPPPPSGSPLSLEAHLEANGYLDMGTELPSGFPPPLPAEISANVSGKSSSDASVQSLLSALRNQDPPNPGFAFGAQVRGNLHLQLLFLYAKVDALLGFDVGLQYVQNPPSACLSSGEQFGFNNWYATGQLYAYLNMDVGIHVDVWLVKGDFTLAQMSLGALLQAGLPNPTWMNGNVHIEGNILGGLVKVDDNFPFHVGKACTIPYNPLDNIKMITDVGPKDNAGVFDKPFAVFNLPMNKDPMDMTVPADSHHDSPYTRTFRFYATNFELYKVKNGGQDSLIQGRPDVSADGKTITLYRNDMLQAHTKYKIYIKCKAEEKINRSWENPAEGATTQDTSIFFTTGAAPDKISPQNVAYTYPIDGQNYLLKNEFSNLGRIKLGMWQNNILPIQRPGMLEYNYTLKFIPENNGGDTLSEPFTPNKTNKSLDFQIPPGLQNSTIYTMQVWVKPVRMINVSQITNQSNNNFHVHYQVQNIQRNGMVSTLQRNSAGNLVQSRSNVTAKASINNKIANMLPQSHPLGSEPIYSIRFRTSKFNTFAEKMDALDPLKADPEDIYKHIKIYSNNDAAEKFDVFEIKGFNSNCTTSISTSGNGNHYPPLFSASIHYDAGNATDKYFMDNLYLPSFSISLALNRYGFNINLGAPEVRNIWTIGFPVYTLSTESMAYSPKLPPLTIKSSELVALKEGVQGNAQIVNAITLNGGSSKYSFAGTNTMNNTNEWATGNNVAVPSSYAQLHSNYLGKSGSSGTGISISNNPNTYGISNLLHSFQLVWKRDEYIYADYQLLKQFYHTFEQSLVPMPIIGGDIFVTANNPLATGEYGSITFGGNNYLSISQRQMQTVNNQLNKIKNLNFVSTRQLSTTRNIYFQYRYPCPNCGVQPVTVIKHLNELRLSKTAQHQLQESQQISTGTSSSPLILHFK